VLGEQQREVVMRTIATTETQIRARTRGPVPARRANRPTFAEDDDAGRDADTERLRVLNTMLMKKADGEAEVVASDRVMRIMAVAQSAGKQQMSSIDVIESIMVELAGQHCSR